MKKQVSRLVEAFSNFIGPLLWPLSLLPPVMLNALTSACAALIVVFVFGFAVIGANSLRPAPPIVPLSAVSATPASNHP